MRAPYYIVMGHGEQLQIPRMIKLQPEKLEHCGASMSKQMHACPTMFYIQYMATSKPTYIYTVALNCCVSKALPVKYQITANRL